MVLICRRTIVIKKYTFEPSYMNLDVHNAAKDHYRRIKRFEKLCGLCISVSIVMCLNTDIYFNTEQCMCVFVWLGRTERVELVKWLYHRQLWRFVYEYVTSDPHGLLHPKRDVIVGLLICACNNVYFSLCISTQSIQSTTDFVSIPNSERMLGFDYATIVWLMHKGNIRFRDCNRTSVFTSVSMFVFICVIMFVYTVAHTHTPTYTSLKGTLQGLHQFLELEN